MVRAVRAVKRGYASAWIIAGSLLHLRVGPSNIPHAGNGLFAYSKTPDELLFRAGNRICRYNGEVITRAALEERFQHESTPYSIALPGGMAESAERHRGIGALANHSGNIRAANARLSVSIQRRGQIIATKNIRAGQEILVNYGDDYDFDVQHSTNNKKRTL